MSDTKRLMPLKICIDCNAKTRRYVAVCTICFTHCYCAMCNVTRGGRPSIQLTSCCHNPVCLPCSSRVVDDRVANVVLFKGTLAFCSLCGYRGCILCVAPSCSRCEEQHCDGCLRACRLCRRANLCRREFASPSAPNCKSCETTLMQREQAPPADILCGAEPNSLRSTLTRSLLEDTRLTIDGV